MQRPFVVRNISKRHLLGIMPLKTGFPFPAGTLVNTGATTTPPVWTVLVSDSDNTVPKNLNLINQPRNIRSVRRGVQRFGLKCRKRWLPIVAPATPRLWWPAWSRLAGLEWRRQNRIVLVEIVGHRKESSWKQPGGIGWDDPRAADGR